PDAGVLVLDYGGGTIDITTYTIRQSRGGQKGFEESLASIGGKCGSKTIDRNMYKLMNERYGSAWTAVSDNWKSPGSRYMTEFEDHKRNFGSMTSNSQDMTLRLRTRVEELQGRAAPQYDVNEGEITLTAADMQKCFDFVVAKILSLIKEQLREVRRARAPKVNTIVQIGGFGDLQYLCRKVMDFCAGYDNLCPIVPNKPWSAIARGACLRGLGGALVEKRRCRRHYGTSLAQAFRSNIDAEGDDVYVDKY
ncbi:hypothetical protein LTR66_017945, partial [Elasticomyces elasticus]